MFFLVQGPRPGDPTDKLCPSAEPKEAMAQEAPMEGWFSRSREEQHRYEIAQHRA